MSLSAKTKKKVDNLIFDRAYEIEQMLSENDFFMAKLCGVKPEQVEDVSLRLAVKELQKTINA